MPSRRILTISAVTALTCGYFYFFEYQRALVIPMGIALVVAILTYVLQHQINWWWYKRHPPKLPAPIDALYRKVSPWYNGLNEENKSQFGARVSLFVEAKEFIGQGIDKLPEDLKYMVAFYGIRLSFNKEKFLYEGYDRIVFYLHPFLTPNFPDHVHTYEVEDVDGTIILSTEQMTASFLAPRRYYATGLHALAEVYRKKFDPPALEYPDNVWEVLEQISSIKRSQIEDFTGMPQKEPWPVVVHHWHIYPTRFLEIAPSLHAQIERIFG